VPKIRSFSTKSSQTKNFMDFCQEIGFCQETAESIENFNLLLQIIVWILETFLSWLKNNDIHIQALKELDAIFDIREILLL